MYCNLEEKKLPDYQIIEWNEDNFDMHENRYIEQAYAAKKMGLRVRLCSSTGYL